MSAQLGKYPRLAKYLTRHGSANYLRAGSYTHIGIDRDGTLLNPNGYPEAAVFQALEEALQRRHDWRTDAAKRAAVTRARRREKRIADAAARYTAGNSIGPRETCVVCRKTLTDPVSISRGIGSDCWQEILKLMERGP